MQNVNAYDNLKKKIAQFAKQRGLLFGVCHAKPLEPFAFYTERPPFVRENLENRTDPQKWLESVKSVLVFGMGYGKQSPVPSQTANYGVFSSLAISTDYHKKLGALLDEVVCLLQENADGLLPIGEKLEWRKGVDQSPLLEREFAKKAGIGWQGKNTNLISKAFGSFFTIGLIVTNLPLPVSKPYESHFSMCGTCKRCIEACPSCAIAENGYAINGYLCVSYLTQKKGELSQTEQLAMGNRLYGCDQCQNVCPFNHHITKESLPNVTQMYPNLNEFSLLTKEQFKEQFGETSLFWRGHKVLMRNAQIAKRNLEKTRNERHGLEHPWS